MLTDDVADLFDCVRPAENQEEARGGVVRRVSPVEIFQDIIANQRLSGAMPRILRRDDPFGIAPNELPHLAQTCDRRSNPRPVREMSRETMPPVRDLRIEWGVTMT